MISAVMPPRQVKIGDAAAFAGTTPRAIRHYHEIGLLPEPERGGDGRRRYGHDDMTRLLWIRKMADAGISLDDMRAAFGEAQDEALDIESVLSRLEETLAAQEAAIKRRRAAVQRLQAVGSPLGLLSELVTDRLSHLPPGALRPSDLDALLVTERIFGPLGLTDTGFSVPAADIARLATSYGSDPETGAPTPYDEPGGQWSRPPAMASGAGGLVSTIDDYLAFAHLLLAGGSRGGERILARPSVELLTTDQLTSAQKAATTWVPGAFDSTGWGFGVSVRTRRTDPASVGSYGWDGGLGTSWANDPREDLIGVVLTQAMFTSPSPPPVVRDFWAGAYQAIDD